MTRRRMDIEAILQRLPERRRTPVNTYRLQFHRGFGFNEARAILPYLAMLGITDCYSSPILKARPGSTHGYDICDHNALNPDLGTEQDFERFAQELQIRQMGHILDFVPNHMGVDPETNPWWHDVLENGPGSPYAKFFDIHWSPIKPQLKGKVLLPILGDQYGIVLERGEFKLEYKKGAFSLRYHDQRLPLDPRHYPEILRHALPDLKRLLKDDDPSLMEYLSILTAFENLPANTETAFDRVAQRRREKAIAQSRLARLARASHPIEEHIEKALRVFNGQPGQAESFNALHDLLEAQAYRLAYWKTAFHEINYRRFFDINALAGLRIENPAVFPATHKLIMRLIAEGKITGLRIDHPDGLYDPAGYFEAVQDLFLQEWVRRHLGPGESLDSPEQEEAIRAWRVAERKKDPKGLAARPLYIVAEKILSSGEDLDPHWAIDGTSGYEFLNEMNRLFIHSLHADRMQEIYSNFSNMRTPFEQVAYICKKLIMSTSLASELNVLAYALDAITERNRRSRDFTLDSLRDALKEVIACFPVYRTYINASRASAADRAIISRAIEEAQQQNPAVERSTFQFIYRVLTPENAGEVSSEDFRRELGFSMKLQQYTGPVQAKGLEDTAFYRYNLLLSMNEVGGEPRFFGSSTGPFHLANQRRREAWRYSMLTTSTHDTKRGEDSRARINLLSEIPDEWAQQVRQWAVLNANARTPMGKDHAPDRNDEYHFYQTLLGAWAGESSGTPLESLRTRVREYMLKAIKEAKRHTSWVAPNEAYEKGVAQFVETVLNEGSGKEFLASFVPFARHVARLGAINSLAQVVLKAASPGVCDIYQGAELWNLSLVDPDNRREVDYARHNELLNELSPLLEQCLGYAARRRTGDRVLVGHGSRLRGPESYETSAENISAELRRRLDRWEDGTIKMFVTAAALRFRQRHPELFLEGAYLPLEARGPQADHVVAFARTFEDHVVVAVVPRLIVPLIPSEGGWPLGSASWGTTSLIFPAPLVRRIYRGVLTPGEWRPTTVEDVVGLPLGDLLKDCPVGLFYSGPDSGIRDM